MKTLNRRTLALLPMLLPLAACQTLNAPGGFVAIRRGGQFLVVASRSSVREGSELSAEAAACEDVVHPKAASLASIAWLAPSIEGRMQVAVVGIEKNRSRLEYSKGNLELLAEAADQIGTLVSLSQTDAAPAQSDEPAATTPEWNSVTGELMDSIAANSFSGISAKSASSLSPLR